MKVRMKVSMHGPETARDAHEVHEVGDEEGARLIAADFAEPVDDDPAPPAPEPQPEPAPKKKAAPKKKKGKAPAKNRETADAKPDAEER